MANRVQVPAYDMVVSKNRSVVGKYEIARFERSTQPPASSQMKMKTMQKASLYSILLFTSWLFCGLALAQSSPDPDKCFKAASGSSDEKITDCTLIITSGQLSSTTLALTFYNRGNIWQRKGDYDRAIADYDNAIRLNPQHAGSYMNRGN